MAKLITTWKIVSPLHIGAGTARAGLVDSLVRRGPGQKPEIPGDAVKLAIRQSAERLARWVTPALANQPEKNDSISLHPVLRRIFTPDFCRTEPAPTVCYRFRTATYASSNIPFTFLAASTAINEDNGVAQAESLRIFEHWERNLRFEVELEVRGAIAPPAAGALFSSQADLEVLCLALLLADSVGGKRGIGCGAIECSHFTFRSGDIVIDPARPTLVAEVHRYLNETWEATSAA